MHCEQPACASACPTTAMFKTDLGPVVFDESRCIGCHVRAGVPIHHSEIRLQRVCAPKIHKCTFCADRLEIDFGPRVRDRIAHRRDQLRRPRRYGCRSRRRIAEAPGTYIPEIYGLEEVGGTSVLHLSSVPFEQIGYVTGLPKAPMPDLTHRWLRMTAPVFAVLYAVFGALNWIVRRRMRRQGHDGEHP